MKKLSVGQAEKLRKKYAADWEMVKGKYLRKDVEFDDYNQTIRFFMALEKYQVKLDHFADFKFFYNQLKIAITTHDVEGLTVLDFKLASITDKILDQMNAKMQ